MRYDIPASVADCTFITIGFQLAPLFEADGELIEPIAAGVDITHRKQVEQTQAESEARFRAMTGQLPLCSDQQETTVSVAVYGLSSHDQRPQDEMRGILYPSSSRSEETIIAHVR